MNFTSPINQTGAVVRPFKLILAIAVSSLLSVFALSVNAQTGNAPAYQLDASIAEIMDSIVMPSADVLWNAVAIDVTTDGIKETKPTTDDDWDKLRWSAVALAEATNLVIIPNRRVAPAGTVSEAPGVELGPEQINTLIQGNRQAWVAHALVLHTAAMEAIQMIDKRDVDGLSDVGGTIDAACESCHLQFWYPDNPPQ